MISKPFPAKVVKTGKHSIGITIPSALRDKFEVGKVYNFEAGTGV